MAHSHLTENTWGGYRTSPVHYHADGPIGTAVERMGAAALHDVNGKPLGDVLGEIATQVMLGEMTAQQGLDAVKDVRGQLPDGGPDWRHLDWAIADMDAPAAPPPVIPASAPTPLRQLAARLHEIPLVRRDPSREADRLARLMDDAAAGKIGGLRLARELRSLANNRHESLGDSGKFEIDRAVLAAVKALEENNQKERDLRGRDVLPIPDPGELAAAGVSRDEYVAGRTAYLNGLQDRLIKGRLTSERYDHLRDKPVSVNAMVEELPAADSSGHTQVADKPPVAPTHNQQAADTPAAADDGNNTAEIAAQLKDMRKQIIAGPDHGVTREAAAALLDGLTVAQLRDVAGKVGLPVSALPRRKDDLARAAVEGVVGAALDHHAIMRSSLKLPAGDTGSATPVATGSGEVVDLATAIAEAKDMLECATAELEDAAAEEQRAREDAKRVELFAGGIAALDFPELVQQRARELMESNSLRVASVQGRKAAAEVRRSQAAAMLDVLRKHQEIKARADELGGMAGKQAYGA